MRDHEFSPGCRLSYFDIIVLLVAIPAAGVTAIFDPWIGVAVAMAVGHFFLFCNVFRISRTLELVWASLFVIMAYGAAVELIPPWPLMVAIMLVTTVTVVDIEMRKPSYHGVGWQRINPGLRDWWEKQRG